MFPAGQGLIEHPNTLEMSCKIHVYTPEQFLKIKNELTQKKTKAEKYTHGCWDQSKFDEDIIIIYLQDEHSVLASHLT